MHVRNSLSTDKTQKKRKAVEKNVYSVTASIKAPVIAAKRFKATNPEEEKGQNSKETFSNDPSQTNMVGT